MIIYNVTIKVEWSIVKDWVPWMQQVHMPEIIETGCFAKHQLVKLLQVDDNDGPTYAAQYYASSFNDYERFINQHALSFNKKATQKWGENFVDYRTVMQIVEPL